MVSIIVPIYNSEKWLKKCIESLISQTYTDIEIILINDGSKDNSLKICREYEAKDSRIVVIDKENGGVSRARNEGIKKANGEYIQFVDSDDYIEKNACEKLVLAIEGNDLAICGLNVWENGKLLRSPHLDDGNCILRKSVDEYFKLRKINLGPCNKLYRKSLIKKLFREDLSLGEDTLFVLDYMESVEKIRVIPDCLYNVSLDNDNSLNRKSKADKIDSLIEQRIIEENFLKEKYGENCDLTKMYNQYTRLMHAWFLNVSHEKNFRELIGKYILNDLLKEKIKKSAPERYDYKIFRFLYVRNCANLMFLYFKIKNIILKIMH